MATGSASAIFHSHLTLCNDPITKGRKKAGLNLMYPAQGPQEAGPPVWQTALKCRSCYPALVIYPLTPPAGKGERTQCTQLSRTGTETTLLTTADRFLAQKWERTGPPACWL